MYTVFNIETKIKNQILWNNFNRMLHHCTFINLELQNKKIKTISIFTTLVSDTKNIIRNNMI